MQSKYHGDRNTFSIIGLLSVGEHRYHALINGTNEISRIHDSAIFFGCLLIV